MRKSIKSPLFSNSADAAVLRSLPGAGSVFCFPHPAHALLFAGWLLAMIALPIALFIWGEAALSPTIGLTVLIQTALVLALMAWPWGWRRTALTALVVMLLTWLAEAIGTATGLPFGEYRYSALLQPQVAHVPLIIPLAWLMMLPSAWCVAYRLTGRWRGWQFVLISALALTAWDLFLDPQMVAWGFWEWASPGLYFGIPLINFFGWLLTAAIITVAARPRPLPVAPFFLIYLVTWLLETMGQIFFWDLVGPGLVGFVVMGAFVLLAWASPHRADSKSTT